MNNISEIKEYAKKNSIPIVMDNGSEFICQTIINRKCKKILEIGSAIGYSAIKFALLSSDIYVRTIEIEIDRYIRAVENIKNCGLENRIKITHEDALYANIDEKFDLIFIDAAKAQYEKFFEKYKNNLAENGVIITDNLFFHGMIENPNLTHNYSTIKLIRKIKKFISFLEINPEFNTTINSIGDGVSLSLLNPDFIQPEYKKILETKDKKILQEIEYKHTVYSIFENENKTGIFSYYKKEDYFIMVIINFFNTKIIERTLKNMLIKTREDAIKNNCHQIKFCLPTEDNFNEIINSSIFIKDGTNLVHTF